MSNTNLVMANYKRTRSARRPRNVMDNGSKWTGNSESKSFNGGKPYVRTSKSRRNRVSVCEVD